jgi:Fe(3+) dicitrate transport protein
VFYFKKPIAITFITSFVLTLPVFADEQATALEKMYITGGADDILRQPGSATLIDDVALEKFEYTDIHRVLNAVPGVNLQEEDGYGLRPNIGLRGTSPERSKKITIMEDGVLSGPAPYAAPAAYYFPNISRMSAVEVFKGPATIQYGPATVGGAINMVSRPIPYNSQGELDLQYGSDNFQRLNVYQGQQVGDFGYLIEGLRVSADGFKDLDKGGDTGFERNDINVKTSWQTFGQYNHSFVLKLGYADELSNETYLGLTRDDLDANPYRRYNASSLDEMEWTHEQFQLTHQMDVQDVKITSDVYRNNFDRDWFKVNGFKALKDNGNANVSIQDVLADPTTYQTYYQVLSGQAASSNSDEYLRIGNNGRIFVSQGIQTRINMPANMFGLNHEIEIGIRYHEDEIKRNHSEQYFATLADGSLQVVTDSLRTTTLNKNDAQALAIYAKDQMHFGDTTITAGIRHEEIMSTKTTYGQFTGIAEQEDKLEQSVTLPGIGIYSQLNQRFGVLAGVHKGFTAATPGGSGDIKPEESTNYEMGFRYFGLGHAEVIAFLNDYTQFSGTCSFAQGSCSNGAVGEQTNAGNAQVYGIEASWKHEKQLDHFKLPLSATYTYSHGEFGESFKDVSGAFGEKDLVIEDGFEIGYLPEHRLNLQAGIGQEKWQANISVLYQSDMRNIPSSGAIPVTDRIDEHTVVDVSASYELKHNIKLYSSIDNVFDHEYVVSAKPYGYRPGKPLSFHVGTKFTF